MQNDLSQAPSLPDIERTALAVFAFNRPQAFVRLIKSLILCPEFLSLPVYLFIDGPRSNRDILSIQEITKFSEQLDHPNKIIIQRQKNIGLKSSLRAGVSQVLEVHSSVIVLEDDLIVGPEALDFFLRALDRYRDERRVASICGYALVDLALNDPDPNLARFLPMTHPWGWATWRDRWLTHAENWGAALDTSQVFSRSFRSAMNVFRARNYTQMLQAAEKNIISSWWIYWQNDAIVQHQISLFASRSQVINGDVNETGTHASRWNFFRRWLPRRTLSNSKAMFPKGIRIDFALLDKIVKSREARIYRIIGFVGFLRYWLFRKSRK